MMRIRTVENAENSMLALLYIARLGNSGKTQVAHVKFAVLESTASVGCVPVDGYENEVKGVK